MKYEGSMINHTGSRGNYSEKEKWLLFKNIGHIDLLFHVKTLGAQYEVCMIKPVAKRTVHIYDNNNDDTDAEQGHVTDNSQLQK